MLVAILLETIILLRDAKTKKYSTDIILSFKNGFFSRSNVPFVNSLRIYIAFHLRPLWLCQYGPSGILSFIIMHIIIVTSSPLLFTYISTHYSWSCRIHIRKTECSSSKQHWDNELLLNAHHNNNCLLLLNCRVNLLLLFIINNYVILLIIK